MTNIKICGITNLADAKLAQKLGARFLGFVFYPKSPRCITPEEAKKIISKLSKSFPVAVFVNEPLSSVRQIAQYCGIRFLQLHGDESPQYCDTLRREGFKVIKAFRIKDKKSLGKIEQYNYKVNAFLFDTFSKESFGGTGKAFDWKILKQEFTAPIFLSGGINVRNVRQAVKSMNPYAIDVSSSLEAYPGKKDPMLLRQFFSSVNRNP